MADYTNVEGLVIEIETDAGKAASDLESMTQAIEKFRDAVSSARPLSTFARNFTTFVNALNAVPDVGKFTQLAASLTSLSALGQVKFSTTIAKELNNIAVVSQTMVNMDFSKLEELAVALSHLQGVSNLKISPSIGNQLERIANLSQTIKDMDFSKLTELVAAIEPLSTFSATGASSLRDMATGLKTFSSAARTATSHGRRFNTVLANIRVKTLMLFAALRRVSHVMQDGLSEYGDYVETLNLFSVSMDEAGQSAYEFGLKAQNILGIDLTQWMKAQGVFMALGKGFGIAGDRAALMSQQLTQLAYDISSFYNIDVQSAIEKVQSGFAGQLRPLRALGYDLSQAKLEAIALSLGIDKSVKSMTQAEKAQLRYMAMITQVKDVQGDLARTLNSPINQMRILQAQVTQMKRSLGLVLLPILNEIIPVLNAIFRVIKMIFDEVAAFFGYELPQVATADWSMGIDEDVVGITDDIDDATEAAERLKNTLASFDQINLITSTSGGAGGKATSALSGEGFDFELPTYDFLGDAAENKAKELAETIKKNIQPALDGIAKTIQFIVKYADEFKVALGLITGAAVLGALVKKIKDWSDKMDKIAGTANGIKTALGIGFMIGGITFAYSGGKSYGEGDITEGIIKAVLGTSVAAIGGALAFGATGVVIGVGLSLSFFYLGFMEADAKATRERVESVFGAVKEGKGTIDELIESWNEMIKAMGIEEIDTTGLAEAQNDVNLVVRSIDGLRNAYSEGLISTEEFIEEMGSLFGDLKEAVRVQLEETTSLILKAFEGSLGVYVLTKYGKTPKELEELLKGTSESIMLHMDEAQQKIDELNQKLAEGMPKEEYESALQEILDSLEPITGEFSTLEPAVKSFNDLMARGVNITSVEEAYKAFEDIYGTYNKALGDLNENRKTLTGAFEYMKQNAATPEEAAQYQEWIDATNNYYDEQIGILKGSLSDAAEMIKNEVGERWVDSFNANGLADTVSVLGEDMDELGEYIHGVLTHEEVEDQQGLFSDIIQVYQEYRDKTEELLDKPPVGTNNMLNYYADIEREMRNIVITYSEGHDEWQKTSKSWTELTEEWKDKNLEILKKHAKDVKAEDSEVKGSYGAISDGIINSMMPVPDKIREIVRFTAKNVAGEKDNFFKSGYELMGQIEYAFSDPTKMLERSLNWTLDERAKQIRNNANSNKFKASGTALRMSLTEGFSDPNEGFKKKVQSVVDNGSGAETTKFKKLGQKLHEKIIEGFGEGSSDGESKLQQGVEKLQEKIRNKFNLGNLGKSEGNQFVEELEGALKDGESGIKEAAENVAKQISDSMLIKLNLALVYTHQAMMKMIGEMNDLKLKNGQLDYEGDKNKPPQIIPVYAQGGYPTSGQLFFANENGVAEYVGSMGNRTAVANNDQIVTGVSNGVLRALRDTGIAGDVKVIAKKSGKVVFAPSEEAGRVVAQSLGMYDAIGGRY